MEVLDTDLTSLLERIAQALVLREHHVWEAARCLSIDLRDRRASSSTRRFDELIAAGAMLDAVMMLTAMLEPQRFVTSIRNVEGRWLCTVRVEPVPTQKAVGTFRAEHADLPAAILTSFLLSFLKSRRGSGRGTPPPPQQCSKGLEHHDT
jgi:hypothetical protein